MYSEGHKKQLPDVSQKTLYQMVPIFQMILGTLSDSSNDSDGSSDKSSMPIIASFFSACVALFSNPDRGWTKSCCCVSCDGCSVEVACCVLIEECSVGVVCWFVEFDWIPL